MHPRRPMKSLADALPPEIARQIHPDWRKNEAAYWAVRDQLLGRYGVSGLPSRTAPSSLPRPLPWKCFSPSSNRHDGTLSLSALGMKMSRGIPYAPAHGGGYLIFFTQKPGG